MPRHRRAHDAEADEAYGFHCGSPEYLVRLRRKAGAAPHPPAGTFSPYSDGEKAPTLAIPSPRSSRGEGKGEGSADVGSSRRLSRRAALPG
ncbi:hypothetical protein EN784_31325 [bacterium M00.F.Ca.ET.141.01.1.1]|nr:hypothetical protein EN808_08510 [Mesorhizobium sp. M8A.F.Ca.ET.165.01.1.1]TGV54974.1 hypothetical protein EN784_31325 [bacterium M00.F.Ca.ET.141.01.1.1]